MRRKRAEWMNPIDDYIMELLLEQGAGTPASLANELSRNNDYVGTRCRLMVDHGLIERPSTGLYRLTDEGRAYLEGELDVDELQEDRDE